jgi:RNA polymerase sigma factor (sigma-70 family)
MQGESLVSPKVPAASPSEMILARPEVRSAIAAVLWKHRVPSEEVEDLTQEVLARALTIDDPPATLPACIALVRKMATFVAIDCIRRRRRVRLFDVGPDENPDERAELGASADDVVDSIDRRRQIDFVRRAFDGPTLSRRQVAILRAEIDDIPQSDVAQRLRIAFQTARNELTTARRTLRDSWTAYAAVGLAALVGLLAGLLRDRHRPALADTDVPEPKLDHPVAAPELTPQETADAFRRMALHACDVGDWVECVRTFDRAAEIDPAGDTKPWVQKAKLEALRHIDEK